MIKKKVFQQSSLMYKRVCACVWCHVWCWRLMIGCRRFRLNFPSRKPLGTVHCEGLLDFISLKIPTKGFVTGFLMWRTVSAFGPCCPCPLNKSLWSKILFWIFTWRYLCTTLLIVIFFGLLNNITNSCWNS